MVIKNKEFKIFNGLDNRINVSDFTLDGSIGNNFSILNNYSSTLWIDNNAIISIIYEGKQFGLVINFKKYKGIVLGEEHYELFI